MTLCRSAIKVHFAHIQSFHLQYRLCPKIIDTFFHKKCKKIYLSGPKLVHGSYIERISESSDFAHVLVEGFVRYLKVESIERDLCSHLKTSSEINRESFKEY